MIKKIWIKNKSAISDFIIKSETFPVTTLAEKNYKFYNLFKFIDNKNTKYNLYLS